MADPSTPATSVICQHVPVSVASKARTIDLPHAVVSPSISRSRAPFSPDGLPLFGADPLLRTLFVRRTPVTECRDHPAIYLSGPNVTPVFRCEGTLPPPRHSHTHTQCPVPISFQCQSLGSSEAQLLTLDATNVRRAIQRLMRQRLDTVTDIKVNRTQPDPGHHTDPQCPMPANPSMLIAIMLIGGPSWAWQRMVISR